MLKCQNWLRKRRDILSSLVYLSTHSAGGNSKITIDSDLEENPGHVTQDYGGYIGAQFRADRR